MGINWWESDPALSSGAREIEQENEELKERLDRLERLLVAALPQGEGEQLIEEHHEEHEEVLDSRGEVIDEHHEERDDVRVERNPDE
jgi:hypothetical protein